jgi:hypothetical protein
MQAAAFIFVLNYTAESKESFRAKLTSLYRDYVSQRSYFMSDISSRPKGRHRALLSDSRWTEQSALSYRTPLLIFVSIDHPNGIGSAHRDSNISGIISEAVGFAKSVMQSLVMSDAFSSDRGWYIQPYDAFAPLGGTMKNGVFAGLNWLTRAMQKVNSASKA